MYKIPVIVKISQKLFDTAVSCKNCRQLFIHHYSKMSYSIVERGAPNSLDYRIYFKNKSGLVISPLHDIPLFSDAAKKVFNMVVEIPRWTNAKMEINLKELMNPIKQDVKKEKLRFVANCFPHHGYIWNYGALPQTWENPEVLDEHTGFKGDNDPIDVLEIGYRVAKRGEVIQVKVLGTIALIDEGETDWKIITIDTKDPLADELKDINDVDKFFPGLLKATIEWFKIYKIPDGKPENQFAFNGEAKNRDYALKVIQDVHKHWQGMVLKEGVVEGISRGNITLPDSPYKIEQKEADSALNKAPVLRPPAPIDASENLKRLQEKLDNLSSSDESEEDGILKKNNLSSDSTNTDSILKNSKTDKTKVSNRKKRKCREKKLENSLTLEDEINVEGESYKSSFRTSSDSDSFITETITQNNLAALNNSAVVERVLKRSRRLQPKPKVSNEVEPNIVIDICANDSITGRRTRARKRQRNVQNEIPTIILDEDYPILHCSYNLQKKKENPEDLNESVDYDAISETVTVFVNWNGKDCKKFEVPRYRPMKSIFEHYAEKYNIPLTSVVLIRDWEMINPADTPDALKFKCVQYLQGLKANTEQNYEQNRIPKHVVVDKNDLTLKVLLQNQRPLILTIKKNQPMKVIVAKCAAELDCPDENVVLFLDGEKIELESTPQDLDLNSEDCVDACIRKSK